MISVLDLDCRLSNKKQKQNQKNKKKNAYPQKYFAPLLDLNNNEKEKQMLTYDNLLTKCLGLQNKTDLQNMFSQMICCKLATCVTKLRLHKVLLSQNTSIFMA